MGRGACREMSRLADKELFRMGRLENGLQCLEIDGVQRVGLGAFLRTARQILRYEIRRTNEEFCDWYQHCGMLTQEIIEHTEKMSLLARGKADIEAAVELAKSNGHFEECKLETETILQLYFIVEKSIMAWEPEDASKYVVGEELWRGPEERWNRNWNAVQWEDFMVHLTAYYYRACLVGMRGMSTLERKNEFDKMYRLAHDVCPAFMTAQWEQKCKEIGISTTIGWIPEEEEELVLRLTRRDFNTIKEVLEERLEELGAYGPSEGAEADLKDNLIKETSVVLEALIS